MSTFVSSQDDDAPAPAAFWPSVVATVKWYWRDVVAKFRTTNTPNPTTTSPLPIAANTILEQDKATVLRCWLAVGGKEDVLRRRYMNRAGKWKARDDVSKWLGVTVEGGRVTELWWPSYRIGEDLTGTIPAEIGALSALTVLNLSDNKLNGAIPPTIGALSSLTYLFLNNNSLSGVLPYSFSNLLNLAKLTLQRNNLSNDQNQYLGNKPGVQDFFISLFRHPTIRLLNFGIAITKKRQASLDRRISPRRATPSPHPFFAFLADHEHGLTDLIMSFLDPLYCCNKDRTALLKCWKSLGGAEDKLRQGYGDDVTRWDRVMVEGGRVVEVNWGMMGLKGNLPSEIGELDGLRELRLWENEISSIPSEIGKLTSLTRLSLWDNHLADLPRELGNLRSLTDLSLSNNRLSVLPSTLANLTNLSDLSLFNNNFPIDFPSDDIQGKEQVQTFLATLKSTAQN